MKTLLVLLTCINVVFEARAQGPQEWFNQNNTQRAYMLAQIAALQTYLDYSQKGYNLVRDGLQTVSSIKNGDYNLHQAFIDKYLLVSPTVKKYSRVADILSLQQHIISSCRSGIKLATTSSAITSETSYLLSVFTNAINMSADNLDDLKSIIVNANVQMTDAERLIEIDKIYHRQIGLYSFVRSFETNTQLLLEMKRKNSNDLQTIKNWYEHK